MPAPPVPIPCPFDEHVQRVALYLCSCGMAQPLCKLYFCRHCLDVRCGFCVSHEVDSHYCPNCLENMPSAEARVKRNRCPNCFDCPSCQHTLSTRATSAHTPSQDDPAKMLAKKVYYLACSFCRWTSRDIGMADKPVASGAWPAEKEGQEAGVARLGELQDHYRALAQQEKLEKESRRYLGRKLSYLQLSDKYGLAVARKKAGLIPGKESSSAASPARSAAATAEAEAAMRAVAKPIEEVEILPESLFEQPVDLCQTTNLAQSLAQLDLQPSNVADLFPRHKHLMIKRSQRCRQCEHNLSKPEYNPSSIKFKIQLAAYYHVPEIILFRVAAPPKAGGGRCDFVLKLANPTQHSTQVQFLGMEEYEKEAAVKKAQREEDKKSNKEKKTSIGVLRHPASLIEASSLHKVGTNARVLRPPAGSVFVPPRDETAEFDDSGPDLKGVVDDKDVVAFRKNNKVGVFFSADVDAEVKAGEEVTTVFGMKFVYTNTISALDQRELQTASILVPVYIVLGKAV